MVSVVTSNTILRDEERKEAMEIQRQRNPENFVKQDCQAANEMHLHFAGNEKFL